MILLTLLAAGRASFSIVSAVPTQAAAMPAVRGVTSALERHPIVAIAEAHGIRQAGDFYIALVRDAAFQRLKPDIVIEFASRQSQPLLDAYVLQGDSMPADTLASIWRNTTKVASWEFPTYARWLRAIRAVNLSLPRERRIRVVAGDTRVDWSTMQTPRDWAALGDNDISFARVIATEVLAKQRRALVVLGSNHLMRTGTRDDRPNTATRTLEAFPGSLYVVWLYNGRPGGNEANQRIVRDGWQAPSIVPLRGSWIGSLWAGAHRFDEIADALLYLGPPDSLITETAPAESFDLAYRRELDRRSWIEWGDSTRARRFLKLPPVPPSGTVTEHVVNSDAFGARHVWVYTPPKYPGSCTASGCDLVVAFDGGVYVDAVPLPAILDSLAEVGAIRPTIALLIDDASSTTRLADLANHQRFVTLVSDVLVPWLHTHYRATTDATRTIITGSSAGGLASAFLALERPDLFGNVLSQSGAFWRGNEGSNGAPFEWLTARYAAKARQPIRFFLDVGSTENHGAMNGTAPSILDANRRLHAVLAAKGYAIDYFEVPGGSHAPESWRLRLPIGLARLAANFGAAAAHSHSR